MNIKNHSYLLELLVIFIGLSLAFTLDRVWDNYKQTQAEENYLNGFYKDISDDSAELDSSIVGYESEVLRLQEIIKLIDDNGIPKDSLFVLAQIMASQSKYIPHKITYETLTSGGNLDVISSFPLRQKIAALYSKYSGIQFVEETFNKYTSENIFPFLQNNFDFLANKTIDKNLNRNPVFKNMVVFYYSMHSSKLKNLKEVKEIAEEALTKIKSELDID